MSEESPSYSRVWGPIVHAMVQSGASGQEWAVLVALLRWQRESSNVLSMSVPTICKYTGLDEDTVRHRLSSLSKRYFVSAGGNVRDALVDSYKAANYWSDRAAYIFPLSEYDET